MPLAKIHVLEGQYDEARLARVSSAVQDGLVSTLGIPPDDFFQIIHVLPRSQFLHTPSFLGLNYSDDLILLELTFISGRPKETRLGLLKALNDGLVSAAGISPDDLFILFQEIPGENVSFGRGLAQRARIPDTESGMSPETRHDGEHLRRGPLQVETMMQGDEHQGDRWFQEAMQQAKMAETIQAMKAETRAQGTPLGETGRFTHGALTPDDEGELRYAVTASGGKVILAFGTPVEWIGMTPRMAHQLADALNKWGSET